jgi:hypothetical protein
MIECLDYDKLYAMKRKGNESKKGEIQSYA